MKPILKLIGNAGVFLICITALVYAAINGVIVGHKGKSFVFSDAPVLFIVTVAFYLVAALLFGWLGLQEFKAIRKIK